MEAKKRIYKGAMLLAVAGLLWGASPALARDRDNNPPGPVGGRGTNWENPPGPAGGVGSSPNRHPWRRHNHHYCRYHDCDNNPPGLAGGRGTNWENPPGPAGGPGASPNR